jgi:hypothetical protein
MMSRKAVVRASSLKKFNVDLGPGEIKLLKIQGM